MHINPSAFYLKVRDMYPQSALMESSDYHAGENSLSFIALCPLGKHRCKRLALSLPTIPIIAVRKNR